MRSEIHSIRYWITLGSASAGAAASTLFAALLILQAVRGHGSGAGNILRVALAVISFFVGLFFVIVGTLYRASFDQPHENQFH